MNAAKTHHHGNLREALIEAGIALLRDHGASGLTLRRAAAHAGVSHAAPAHHFAGLNGLRTAIAARAMQMFGQMLSHSARQPEKTAFANLVDMGSAYCNFASRHVDLFHLMFVSADVDRSDQDLLQASMLAYTQLGRVCAPFVRDGENSWVLEHAVWSLTHGNALLQMQDPTRNAMAPVWGPPLEQQYRLLLGMTDD